MRIKTQVCIAETVFSPVRAFNTGYEIQTRDGLKVYYYEMQLKFLARIWLNEDP